jgi:probable HAF family extracellular repeat protein
MKSKQIAASVALLAALPVTAFAETTYAVESILPTASSFENLGDTYLGNGGNISFNIELNASGKHVGGVTSPAGLTLLNSSSWGATFVGGINGSGAVVGSAEVKTEEVPIEHANGVTSVLSTPGGVPGGANGINDKGVVAGVIVTGDGQSGNKGVIWSGGKTTILGTQFGTGPQNVIVTGINDGGTVIGSVMTTTATSETLHPFTWSGGKTTFLPTLGGSYSRVEAINASGVAAGFSSNSKNVDQAVVWSGGKLKPLGYLPGDTLSGATAIDSAGDVVGESFGGAGVSHAFLYQNG